MGESAPFFGLIAYSSFSEACGIQENQLAFLYNLHYMSELFKLCSMHYSLLSYVFASHLGDLLSLIKSEFLFDLLNWHVSGWGVLLISEWRPSSISQVASDRCCQAPPRNFLINWASFATCRTSALWMKGQREQGEIFGLVFLRYCGGYGAHPAVQDAKS